MQLQGALLVGAQLQGASLNGAELQGVSFVAPQSLTDFLADAKPQDASTQLQGASLNGAELQGTSLYNLRMQGASLDRAQLQGAFLNGAQLQGASLAGAQLQGAWLASAQLQGAWLAGAQLQGAWLKHALLHSAALEDVFLWRTEAPEYPMGAWVERPIPEPKYLGPDCEDKRCDWTEASYAALKGDIETVPAGPARDAALRRIALLGTEPYEEDAVSAERWRKLAKETQELAEANPAELAKRLIEIGCNAWRDAPFVIKGLIRQLDVRFLGNSARRKAEVACAFLDEAKCPGARGLSEENKAELRQICGPEAPQPSSDAARPPG